MFCKKCGNQVGEGELFCRKCGFDLRQQMPAGQAPAGQTPFSQGYTGQAYANPAPGQAAPDGTKKSKLPLILGLSAALIVLVVVVGILLSGSGSSEKKIQSKLEKGNELLSDKDYAGSVECFEAVLESDPENVDAYMGLAEAYAELEDPEDLVGVYTRASDNLSKSDLKSVRKAVSRSLCDMLEEALGDGDKKRAKEVYAMLLAVDQSASFEYAGDVLPEGGAEAEPQTTEPDEPAEPAEPGESSEAERYEEFISDTCGDTAIEAYADYFERKYGYKNGGTCYCIYLNNDKIPELIVDSGDAAGGAMIFTYGPDGVSEHFLVRGEFLYWEKTNLIDNYYGHMGYYGDEIFQITNGYFENIAGGTYSIKEEYMYDSDWDDDYKWDCEWMGDSVSMTEYTKKKNSFLPSDDGQWNNSFDIGIAIYDSYSFTQAYYDLQIRWGEADYWDYYGGMEKPNIYIYPDLSAQASVMLNGHRVVETNTLLTINGGQLTASWPEPAAEGRDYKWHVYASADGTLYDEKGNVYSYLFWEGNSDWTPDFSKGFCVKGEDTAEFLRKTLKEMGLTPKEYNEFIVYWAPRMEGNAYNLISFQSDVYDSACPLNVTDASGKTPDNMLRVMMAWKPLDKKVSIAPQTFKPFTRDGFTVVEWGGRECK